MGEGAIYLSLGTCRKEDEISSSDTVKYFKCCCLNGFVRRSTIPVVQTGRYISQAQNIIGISNSVPECKLMIM